VKALLGGQMRARTRALCVGIPLFAGLALVTPARSGAASQEATATGVVVNETGQPVAGAAVWAIQLHSDGAAAPSPRQGEPPAVSGPDGRFTVRGLYGEPWLEICAPGFQYGAISGDFTQAEPRRVVLQPAARLSGRITDLAGKPVAGAWISASKARSMAGCLVSSFDPCPGSGERGTAVSALDGRFMIDHLESGWFSLGVQREGFLSKGLARLHLTAGQTLGGADLSLQRGATITGRVVSWNGSPVAGAEISAYSREGSWSSSRASSDAAGRYQLTGVAPGPNVMISASHPALGYTKEMPLAVVDGDNQIELHLEPYCEIRGHVVAPDGKPVASLDVHLDNLGNKAVTADDGSFLFTGLVPDASKLSVSDERFAPVTMKVTPPARDVEIRLTSGSTLSGRLLGLTSYADARIVARQEQNEAYGKIDAEGGYHIPHLGPGPWEIVASQGSRSVLTRRVVAPGVPEIHLDITFPPVFPVRGRVTGIDGKPVPEARIEIWHLGDTSSLPDRAAPDGSFTLELEAGRYTVAARGGGAYTAFKDEIVVDGPVDGVDIRLEPAVPLRGKILGLQPGDIVGEVKAHSGNDIITGTLDEDGGYAFRALKAGTWKVTAVWSEAILEEEAVSRRLTIPEGAAEASLDLEFPRGAETLLVHGKGGRGLCTLRLLGDRGLDFRSFSDREGVTRFTTLPTGTYKLQAVVRRSFSDRDDVQVLLERTVTIPETGELTLDLTAVCARKDPAP
jgi:protocatechuate 3,4-dioxygenase beta subunit